MTTRLGLVLATTLTVFGAAQSAHAATIVTNNGQPYTYVVHANSAGAGTSLSLLTKQIATAVTYSSSTSIDVGNGDGVAQANGAVKKDGFADITVDPALGFTIMQFKIEGPSGRVQGHDFDLLVTFVGGGTQAISNILLSSNDKLDIFAAGSEIIDSIKFFDLRDSTGASLNFDALKQVSFEAAAVVPEPASWALMIGGFGLVGSTMRGRRRTTVTFA